MLTLNPSVYSLSGHHTSSSGNGGTAAIDPNAPAYSLAARDGILYIGGGFSVLAGETRNHTAAIKLSSGTLGLWNPEANGDVLTIVPMANSVFLGGKFTEVDSENRARLAEVGSGSSSGALDWNPGADNEVRTMLVTDDTVYIGGHFATVGGNGRNQITAIDRGTGEATGGNPDAVVHSLVLRDSMLYIGGVNRECLAAFDAVNGQPRLWNADANGAVVAIAFADNRAYLVGYFSSVAGESRNLVAEVDTLTAIPTAWNPGLADGTAAAWDVGAGAGSIGYGIQEAENVVFAWGSPNLLAATDPLTGELVE